MTWNRIGYIAALFLAFVFAACGGDSGNNATTSEIAEGLSSNSKLSQSTDDIKSCKNDPFFNTWEGCYCGEGVWVCDLSTTSSSTPISSSSSCVNCVMDGSSSSSSNKRDSVFVSAQIVNKTISGLAQKGPFDVGSVIRLYQLDGKTFAQKESAYTSKVADANGAFEISNISQSSPYASIQVNGSYRSEITGKFSNGKITLKSFADLSNSSNININMLTHLTNNRIAYLASTGVSVSEAKKQAESEILKIFNVKDDVKNFENLNLFGKNSGNAVLLTVSALMQRDLNVSDINSLLSDFEKDFEEDGEWNDETAKAKIADWASAKDIAGGLDSIRNNVEKWKIGAVPDFEKYVRNYWYTSYGLGECSKSREGEVLADTNKYSANYEKKIRYICKDGAWRKASYFEMDTYKWEKGEDGEMKKGNVTGARYIYDAEQGIWRDPSAEEQGFGGCTLERENDIAQFPNVSIRYWYICKSRKWVVADTIEVDTQGWAEGADGEIKKGDSTSIFYKYDEVLKKWLTANKNDTTLKLDGCTTKLEGSVETSPIDGSYYKCIELSWKGTKEVWMWEIPIEEYLNPNISYGSMIDSRDGKIYRTVKIGNLEWMAENLNYADSSLTKSLLKSSWCYDNVEANCELGGRLYTWAAAKDSVQIANDLMEYYSGVVVQEPIKGCGYGVSCGHMTGTPSICPPGWRLPMEAEFNKLKNSIGSEKGKSLKGWNEGKNGTDVYGFSALPVGIKDESGNFVQDGAGTCFWSATEVGAGNCRSDGLGTSCNEAVTKAVVMCLGDNIYSSNKRSALSVRCVK